MASTQTMGINDDNSASAANDGVFLPRDILGEILLRVPARPLCRLRAVCRSWRSLLTDDLFVAAHGARQPGPLFAVSTSAAMASEEVEVKFLDASGCVVKQHVTVGPSSSKAAEVQPHLGLVLIRLVGTTPPLRVLDPATGAVSFLPADPSHGCEDDPDYYHMFYLGRAASGEYKVLSLSSPPETRFCKILTLGGTASWRDAPMPPPRVIALSFGTVIANGVVYFLLLQSPEWTIAAFDLTAEQWRPGFLHGPTPLPGREAYTKNSLAEVNGCLAAVALPVSATMDMHMDMWLLVGSGDSDQQAVWCKRCTVAASVIHGRLEDYIYLVGVEPLWVMDDGRVALWVTTHSNMWQDCRNHYMGALRMYDPRTGTCTDVADFGNCIKRGVGVYTGNLLHSASTRWRMDI